MNVLHIVWNLIRGGTEGQCARVALELARQGVRQRVAVFRREGHFLERVEAVCGPVYDVGIRRMLTLQTALRLKALAEFIRREKIDVVHAWDADAAIFGSFAASSANVPLITSRRDLGQIYPAHKLWLMRRADRRARAVVVNAEAIREVLRNENVPNEKIVRLQNVLDVDESDRLSVQPIPESLPPGRLVGMVARLDPEKDAATFLRAAAPVAQKNNDVGFVIAGDGPERGALEALATNLGVRDRVVFLGDITYVPALVKRLTVGVLVPSANEGLSNTILEYMAGRLPVVATDCGGNKELVEDGQSGFITPPGDASAVSNCIQRLLDEPALARAMGDVGRKTVERYHRPEIVAAGYLELYRRVAKST